MKKVVSSVPGKCTYRKQLIDVSLSSVSLSLSLCVISWTYTGVRIKKQMQVTDSSALFPDGGSHDRGGKKRSDTVLVCVLETLCTLAYTHGAVTKLRCECCFDEEEQGLCKSSDFIPPFGA